MTATTRRRGRSGDGLGPATRDGLLVAWRNLKRIPRIPELAIFAILQSIMFVLLFAFVFGGAIPIPGYAGNPNAYREFLMPGIFGQTIVFAAATTAIGMADDTHKGIIDRFRSLPMARSAVLTGRALSDVVYNGGILIVLILSGLAVGWTVHTGIGSLFAGVALMLLFAFAMSWLGIWMGLNVPSVEVAQQVIFTVLFPITFVSNVFVPPQTLPDWLQPIAEWNPTSTLTGALRQLWGNPNPFASDSFPSQNPVLVTLVWVVVIIAVFGPLGVRRYRSMNR
ncbi:MAG TPA: ABC transporter permease [Candidatus Limnocylindrales bacterium]|jgi:ABC transporter DrrB family efflux protein